MRPEILFEDEDVIVIYKPAMVATESRSVTAQDCVSFLKNHRKNKGEEPYIGLIHRLDQPVEGILVFAKNKKSAAVLSKDMKEQNIKKEYLAIIPAGSIPRQGVLKDYLLKDASHGKAQIVPPGSTEGKEAELMYESLGQIGDMEMLHIQLKTGRFHQIRCQLASRMVPIIGDVKYGGAPTGKPLCLAAYHLSFLHPVSRKKMEFQVPPRGEKFEEFVRLDNDR